MSTHTQIEKNGLFELTDEARAELVSSKYYNEDLAPTSVSQRTWIHTTSQCYGSACPSAFRLFPSLQACKPGGFSMARGSECSAGEHHHPDSDSAQLSDRV